MAFAAEKISNDIGLLVANRCKNLDLKPAIVDGEMSISYGELHIKAKLLAWELIKLGISFEDPVSILTQRGASHIIAQVAVVYAKGSCLPLDPCRTDKNIQSQIDLAKSKYMITDQTIQNRQVSIENIIDITDVKLAEGDGVPPDVPRGQPEFRSHILFTSGTTGSPKAVQIPALGILNLSRDPICTPETSNQVVGHINNTSFDVSLVDIWVSLLNGVTIMVLDQQEALNPQLFARSIKDSRVSYLFIPTALFHIIALSCPTAFSDCKAVISSGEALDVNACRAVLENGPPGRLINAYGPSECAVFSFAHVVTCTDVANGYVPIGKPMNHAVAYILDESLKPVSGQDPGEIYLGGVGLTPGYLDNPNATAKSFLAVPTLGPDGEPIRLYSTRDLAYTDKTGLVVYLGRKDREVKFKGYRINLDAVEMELLQTNLITAVAVMTVQPPNSSSTILVACITYISPDTTNQELLVEAKGRLPSYMVPQLVVFEKMPVTPNGKVDRKEATRILMQKLNQRCDPSVPSPATDSDAASPTEKQLKILWSNTLYTVTPDQIQFKSNFFDLGGTSLQVASLLTGIYEIFGLLIPTRDVYQNPELGDLSSLIDEKKSASASEYVETLKNTLGTDAATLWKDIPIPTKPPVDWLSPDEGNVLLTGATGFVGAYLLVELLQTPSVRVVKCLIRAGSNRSALSKLFKNLAKYRLEKISDRLKSKIEVVPGDLCEDNLGLDETKFQSLAEWTSVIFHMGAQVNFNEPYATAMPPNVLGTVNMLRLAGVGKSKSLHFASTISIFGPTGFIRPKLKEIGEDESLMSYLDKSTPYDIGYAHSKWVAEQIISNLIQRGFPASIYRMGTVLCNTADGVGNPDDFVSRVLVDCVQIGAYPILLENREELMPVGYVTSAIILISMSNNSLGKAYHITPDIKSSLDTQDLFLLTGKICQVEMTGLPYWEWVETLRQKVSSGSELRLKPLVPALREKPDGRFGTWELYDGMARYKMDNTISEFKKANKYGMLESSAITEKDLRPYLKFLGLCN